MGSFGRYMAKLRSSRSGHSHTLLGVRTVAGQVLLLELVLVVLLVAAAVVALVVQARHDAITDARRRTFAVAETFAHSPGLQEALNSADPTANSSRSRRRPVRHPVDARHRVQAHGIRYHPPRPARSASTSSARMRRRPGHALHQDLPGSPGPPVVSAAPVKDSAGSTAGLVSVGIRSRTSTSRPTSSCRCCSGPRPPRSPSPRAGRRWSAGGCGGRPTAWARPR